MYTTFPLINMYIYIYILLFYLCKPDYINKTTHETLSLKRMFRRKGDWWELLSICLSCSNHFFVKFSGHLNPKRNHTDGISHRMSVDQLIPFFQFQQYMLQPSHSAKSSARFGLETWSAKNTPKS